MLLSEIIAELNVELVGRGSYSVTVLTRQRAESDTDWGDFKSYSVLDVILDEHDSHVDLLTDEGSQSPVEPCTGMTSEEFIERLRALESRCGAWSVYTCSANQAIDAAWDLRIDTPVVGMGTNHELRQVGLLQFPPEQWSDAV